MRGTSALYIVLGVALVLAFLFSLFVGPASVGPLLMLKALAGQDLDAVGTIVREIRLPRALLGLLIGGALGLSGAALQGYLRNPLAEPGTIGVSSAAALGAVIAFYSGFATLELFHDRAE